MLGKIDGVVDVVGMQRGNPEVTWNIDPVASRALGLTVEHVSSQLAAAWLGDVATDLRLPDRRIPVRVRLPDAFRFDPAKLPQTLIRTADGKLVPLSARGAPVALERPVGAAAREPAQHGARHRHGSKDAISAARSPTSGRELQSLKLPVGYSYEIGGQYESQRQAFRELLMVFGIGDVSRAHRAASFSSARSCRRR